MLNGFLVIDKEMGITSARVVGKVKHLLYILNEKSTKIGHFGTLDPDGEGVLPLALGRATRLFSYQDNKEKVYLTEFRFGISTDTLDTSGRVIDTSNIIPNLEDIQRIAAEMVGKNMQIPPQYSAKSVDGQRAYVLARKGVLVEIPSKEIEIFRFEEIEQIEETVFRMKIAVSAGAYIRSIARDMGEKLGTLCAMQYIKRLKNGVFEMSHAVLLKDLTAENLQEKLLPTEIFLTDFPKVEVPTELDRILLTGSKLFGLTLPNEDFLVCLMGQTVGIGEKTSDDMLRVKTWLL